jgi:hypothetical protein
MINNLPNLGGPDNAQTAPNLNTICVVLHTIDTRQQSTESSQGGSFFLCSSTVAMAKVYVTAALSDRLGSQQILPHLPCLFFVLLLERILLLSIW